MDQGRVRQGFRIVNAFEFPSLILSPYPFLLS
jgi:hypothetical protein